MRVNNCLAARLFALFNLQMQMGYRPHFLRKRIILPESNQKQSIFPEDSAIIPQLAFQGNNVENIG